MAEDIKEAIKEYKEETVRHFDVVAEDLRSDVKTVAEGVEAANQRLVRLEVLPGKVDKIDTRLDAVETTLEVMKQDVSFIKNELKQKVDRDEFAALEKRVGSLEGKLDHQFS